MPSMIGFLEDRNIHVSEIRIILDVSPEEQKKLDSGEVVYWGFDPNTDDYHPTPLTKTEAHDLMRQGVYFVVALNDPQDKQSHYETEQAARLIKI